MEGDITVGEAWEKAVLAEEGYYCRRLLGQGAFSKVYCVEKQADGRVYACKISENIRLLKNEAQIMAELQHPLFPEYFGLREKEGTGFLFMEYVPGESMEEMLRRRGRFQLLQALRAGMELAEGLRYLQEGRERIVYRDVKPANSIIRQDGRVKLLDFGCACRMGERPDSRAGTVGFAAPEQLDGAKILTASCDVYGWGRTMKAMLGIKDNMGMKGACVKDGASGRQGRDRREKDKEKRLWQILDACTRKEASQRIPDMRSVMMALAPLCAEERTRRGDLKGPGLFIQKEIICEKNIVAMGKNS